MITTDGRMHIKRYLAGWSGTIAKSIAFGIGGKAEEIGDTRLQFEVGRSDITITSYDFINDRLIFKAILPDEYEGTITEVALFSNSVDSVAGEYGSKLISSFDSGTEEWFTGAVAADYGLNSRLGADSLLHTPAASGTATSYMNQIVLDFTGYSGADVFKLALNSANANASGIKVRFMNDASNYYTLNFGAAASGYNILSVAKSAAVITGSPTWDNITEIQVETTAGAGGAADVTYDAIRIEDTDTVNSDYVMVSRELLAVPYVKNNNSTQEVEFALEVSV